MAASSWRRWCRCLPPRRAAVAAVGCPPECRRRQGGWPAANLLLWHAACLRSSLLCGLLDPRPDTAPRGATEGGDATPAAAQQQLASLASPSRHRQTLSKMPGLRSRGEMGWVARKIDSAYRRRTLRCKAWRTCLKRPLDHGCTTYRYHKHFKCGR